jgi:predicted enzyme related to lactoylglutathione lyase
MAGRKAVLNQLNIVVCDMRASMAFYRRLGIPLPEPAGASEPEPFHIGAEATSDFDLDLDTAKFAQVWNKGWQGRSDLVGRVVVGFQFDTREDVDATYKELTGAGHKGLQPPFDAFWGARYAVVEDPNGLAVGLMSPIDPGRRSELPED